MTSPMLPERDEDYLRIAEYLLGECSAGEAARVEHALATDPAFRRAAALLGLALPPDTAPPPQDTDTAWTDLTGRMDAMVPVRRTLRLAGVAIAAAVLVIAASVTYRSAAPVIAAHANERYEAPMDAPRPVRLPDGSRATLEPGARLTYRSSFFRRPRLVTLEGEARFQARPDAEHPFEVRAGGVLAVAVGTVFTVRANRWEPSVHVSVDAGVVLVWPDTARAHSPPRTVNAGGSADVTPIGSPP